MDFDNFEQNKSYCSPPLPVFKLSKLAVALDFYRHTVNVSGIDLIWLKTREQNEHFFPQHVKLLLSEVNFCVFHGVELKQISQSSFFV